MTFTNIWKNITGMKTIEERAKEYVPNVIGPNYVELPARGGGFFLRALRDAYIAGAKEQKAIDEEVRLKKCDDMTEAEYNRETAFVDWYLEKGKVMPAYSDAIEWARKDLLDKACEWLDRYLHLFVMKGHINHDALEQEFRKAMEE